MNIIELFNTGGISLVLVAGFISALIWVIKYFVQQIDAAAIERKQLTEEYKAERKELIEKFELMFTNHCTMVADALRKQTEVFNLLIDRIEKMV